MKNNKTLYLFLLRCLGLYIAWSIIYLSFIKDHTDIELWLTSTTAHVTTQLINIFYTAGKFSYLDLPYAGEAGQSVSQILLDAKPLLVIADSCNALTLMVLFAGFIIAYPGDWRLKFPFIAVGSLTVFVINVVRCIVLIFNYLYFRSSFEFNHKYTFTIAVYLCVFYFWMLWANRYGSRKVGKSQKDVISSAA